MLETIKKQKLFFLSLLGIVMVSLIMVSTFAYQKVRVSYDASSKQGMTINVGKLDVTYTSSNYINETNMPLLNSYETADYTEFILDNSMSTDNIYYKLMLSDLEYSDSLITEDFNYTLTEVIDNNESIIGSGDFKFLSGTTHTICFNTNKGNYIYQGKTKKLRLYLWLKETDKNQNNLENNNFKGKIEINSYFESDATKMPLTNVRVYGNSIQNGIPTVENPINIESLGENSKNLFDKNSTTIQSHYYGIDLKNKYDKDITVSFRLKEGKTIPDGVSFGLIFREQSDSPATAAWLIQSGLLNYEFTSTYWYNVSHIDQYNQYYSFMLGCYPGDKETWDLINDSFDIQMEFSQGTMSEYRPYKYIDVESFGKNSFNKDTVLLSAYINNNGDMITPNSLIDISDYIPVQQLTQYNMSPHNWNINGISKFVNCYSESKKLIGTLVVPSARGYFTTLANTRYIKTSVPKNIINEFQIEVGDSETAYEPYQNAVATINLVEYQSLKKIGDVADYIDLTNAKLVKKIGVIESYNGEIINTDYISSTGTLTVGATVYYVLDNEVVTDIDNSILNGLYNYGTINVNSNIDASKIEFSL